MAYFFPTWHTAYVEQQYFYFTNSSQTQKNGCGGLPTCMAALSVDALLHEEDKANQVKSLEKFFFVVIFVFLLHLCVCMNVCMHACMRICMCVHTDALVHRWCQKTAWESWFSCPRNQVVRLGGRHLYSLNYLASLLKKCC